MDVTFDGYRVRGLTMAQKEDFARDKLRKIEQLLGYGEKNINFWNDNYEKIEEEIDTIKILPTVYKNLKERYNKIQKDVVNQNTSQFENVFQVPELRDLIVQNNIKIPKSKTDSFKKKLKTQEPLLLTMERASEDLYNEARRDIKNQCFSKYDENGKKRIMDNYDKMRFCRNLKNDPCKRACDDEIISEPEQVFEPLEENMKYTTKNDEYSSFDLKIQFKRGIYHIKSHKIIKDYTFANYENILPKHSLRIHQSLEHIGEYAFANTHTYLNLHQIYFQDDEIGLQYVIFEKGSNLKYIGTQAFERNPLRKIDLSTTKVTELNERTFHDCKNLSNVNLSQNLVSIEDECFRGCESLKQIQIPNTLRNLGPKAFSDSGLESIDLSNTDIRVIPQYCFLFCENLKSVRLPAKVEKIERGGFEGCVSLELTIIPDNLIEIEDGAFKGCNPSLKMVFLQNGFAEDRVDKFF